MYKYFIEKPKLYNVERAERLSSSIYQSFKTEVPDPGDLESIRVFIKKYNEIPFLSVNFIYKDKSGALKSILEDVKEINILDAEYVFPIKQGPESIGTLLVYDINKEYERGLKEYSHMKNVTRIFFSILLFLLLFLLLYREYNAKIEQQKRLAEFQAVHDGLTGLYTHKYFQEQLLKELSRSERYKRPVSLILCDIDHFKNFNDEFGHLAGDEVLRTVSRIMSDNVRTSDLVARYGGEEFAILLFETGTRKYPDGGLKKLHEEATDAAKRIKAKVESTRVNLTGDRSVGVTISMGVAFYDGHSDYRPEYLISEADISLYKSKNSGRNLITVYSPETKEYTQIQ